MHTSASIPSPTAGPTAGASGAELWLDVHGDALFAFALARVGRRDVAEDLVQDTLLAALRGESTFEGRSSERTWLIGILKNKIAGWRRASRTTSEDGLARHVDEQFTRFGKWRTAPLRWRDPDGGTEAEEMTAALVQCLGKLPDRQVEAVLLVETDRVSAERASEALGVTTNHLYVMLYRARSGLRACLERKWFRDPKEGPR